MSLPTLQGYMFLPTHDPLLFIHVINIALVVQCYGEQSRTPTQDKPTPNQDRQHDFCFSNSMLSEIQIKTRQVNMPKWKTQICTSSTETRRSDLDKMAKHLNTLARIKPSLVCLLNSFTRVSSVLEPNMAIVYSPKITWYRMERTTYIQYMYMYMLTK